MNKEICEQIWNCSGLRLIRHYFIDTNTQLPLGTSSYFIEEYDGKDLLGNERWKQKEFNSNMNYLIDTFGKMIVQNKKSVQE